MKTCIACGMPMKNASDFALGDETRDYCTYCAREDGSMQSFDEKKEGMTDFIMKTQGLDKTVAVNAALAMMRKFPAWQENFSH
ncbi:zinc ribbon domain-containing protein [Lachnospiraceae bacterium ZAX-1]